MVTVRWPRWPPCPYMVKIFKNLLLQNQRCLVAESLHKSLGTGSLPKLLKLWSYLTFDFFMARSSLLPYAFVWEKCSEFQMTSTLEPLGQCCSNFIWSLPRAGKWKIAKMVAVHWPRWPPCPYMVKIFKNLLLQNHVGLGGSVGCAVRLETRRSRVQPPPRSATFFHGDWSWNIFYGHSLPSADSRRAVVSFWRKNVHSTG